LIEGVAFGHGPRVIASNMRAGVGITLDRALSIARTETLRVYRAASQAQYKTSGVVNMYRRMSARDHRVCIACLLMDGHLFPVDEPFAEHVQGRCVPVPEVLGLPVIEWPDGKTWFLAQDVNYQREILGPGRYEAWRAGDFELDEVVSRKTDSVWGDAFIPKPLYELIGG
jgi:SPP1 gp7 family putative phage head morphogenesis protein